LETIEPRNQLMHATGESSVPILHSVPAQAGWPTTTGFRPYMSDCFPVRSVLSVQASLVRCADRPACERTVQPLGV